jgi:hypothetical protein
MQLYCHYLRVGQSTTVCAVRFRQHQFKEAGSMDRRVLEAYIFWLGSLHYRSCQASGWGRRYGTQL